MITPHLTTEEELRDTLRRMRLIPPRQWKYRKMWRAHLEELLDKLLEENPGAVKKLLMETYE